MSYFFSKEVLEGKYYIPDQLDQAMNTQAPDFIRKLGAKTLSEYEAAFDPMMGSSDKIIDFANKNRGSLTDNQYNSLIDEATNRALFLEARL